MPERPTIFYTVFAVDGENQTIKLRSGGKIRARSKTYFKARFEFTLPQSGTNAFLKLDHLSATFSPVPFERSRAGAYIVPLEEDSGSYECEIPWEVLTRKGKVYVGVFAGDMLVTNEAEIEVTQAAPTLGADSQPTQSWWSRFSTALAVAVEGLVTRINGKQDTLTAGDNITIENNVISASGGASIEPYTSNPSMDGQASAGSSDKYARGDHRHPSDSSKYSFPSGGIPEDDLTASLATKIDKAVRYNTAQTLTDTEKARARSNIGAVSLSDIGTVITIKGEVATYADLPASGNAVGDVYYVSSDLAGYVWLETTDDPSGYWKEGLGAPIDLSAYRTAVNQDAIDASLAMAIPSASSVTPQALGTAAAGSSADYSRADHVHKMPTAADVNALPANTTYVASVNGSSGAVTITVPDELADLSDDTTHRLVTDTEKAAWNAKASVPKYTTLTLATSDWETSGNDYVCSKTVTGMTATSIVWLAYSDTETEFTEAQSANTLTFTVSSLPSAAITVNVAFMGGSALT